MKKGLFLIVLTVFLTAFLASCGSYYKITEPTTQKVYYATDIDKVDSGAVSFKDEITQKKVTIQNSEISEISKEEFNLKTAK